MLEESRADYQLRPATVDFGQLPRASESPSTLTLQLRFPHAEVRILDIESSLDFLDIRRDPPSAAASFFRIEVSLPEKLPTGKISGVLKIRTSDPSLAFTSQYSPPLNRAPAPAPIHWQ